jgi:predicted dienelactone hydrolase
MMWLGYRLAAAGYLAAAVDHLGPDNCEPQLAGVFYLSDWHMWERPRDLSVVLDRLLDDELLGPRIDRQRLGAAGFSAGGASVISLVGGRLDLQKLQAGSEPPEPLRPAVSRAITEWQRLQAANPTVRESLQRTDCPCQDDRIRCAFALAPALGAGFPGAGLSAVTAPVCLVAGRDDPVTPLAANAQHFADQIQGAELTVLPGETGHWSSDPGAAVRALELEQVSRIALGFFARHLAG